MTAWADIEPGTSPAVMAIGCDRAEYELCRQLPGARFDEQLLIWRVPLTWAGWCAFSCVWQRQPIYIYPELMGWAAGATVAAQHRVDEAWAVDATGSTLEQLLALEHRDGPQLTPPQRGAAACLIHYPRWLFADERGNGKTPPLCRALEIKHIDGETAPALVICPPQSLLTWQRKLATWAPGLRTVIIAGSAKDRERAITQLRDGEVDVGIIAWSNVRSHTRLGVYPGKAFVRCDTHGGATHKRAGYCEVHLKDFNYPDGDKEHPDGSTWLRTVIADEAHHMADPEAKQTRAVWWLAHHCETFWAVTGTIQPNNPADLWPIFHAMDPLGQPVRSRYLDLYAKKEWAFVRGSKHEEILGLREDNRYWFDWALLSYMRRMPRAIARAGEPEMGEPEFRYPVMGHKQGQLYNAIAKTGIGELADRDYVPANAITAFTRLCQLAGSMIRVTDGEDPLGFTARDANVELVFPSHKVDDLMEFLAAEADQWIIALNSPQLAHLVERKLTEVGITFTHILGGMNYQAKDAAMLAFNSGEARVVIINEAGEEAIDLPAAEGVFFLQPDPSFVGSEQKTGRGDRFGRTTPLRRVYSITPGTVDLRMLQLSFDKEEGHQEVVRDAAKLRWMMDVRPEETGEDIWQQGQRSLRG